MRVFQINAGPYGSTGRIMFQLADAVEQAGGEALCTAGFTWKQCSRPDFFITSNIFEKTFHTWMARFTGRIGCFSRNATGKLLKKIDAFQPDVIHMHNLHCWFVNLPMLFGYLKEKKIPVVWTLHDCWPFTGHCPHFIGIGCEKWKQGCFACPLHRAYPQSYVDASKTMYRLKKEWFAGVEDLTIVTPSQWLADLVKQSFLKEYPVKVIPNGIDLRIFSPKSADIKVRYGIEDKYLLLGVAYAWDNKKGLDVFIELQKRLGDAYRILLVGTDEQVEKRLPPEILCVRRTDSQEALAELYGGADLFVNPTREDNLPTVNMEALSCGTPVLTFQTGGSPEVVDETCGMVVSCNDVDAMGREIRDICEHNRFSQSACAKRANAFDQQLSIQRYLDLYRSKL